MSYAAPPSGGDARAYLLDLSGRREFFQFSVDAEKKPPKTDKAADYTPPVEESIGFVLHPMQGFMLEMAGYNTPVPRTLLGWDTGTGKTIAAISVSKQYAKLFRSMQHLSQEERPRVFVLGFTRAIFQDEMLRSPEHGFITHAELHALRTLRLQAINAQREGGEGSSDIIRQYNGYLGTMRRLLTDPKRGGYFQFYGYKELANSLFNVTPAGTAAGLKITDLFVRGVKSEEADELDEEPTQIETFAKRISAAERKGYVEINEDLKNQFKRGFIIADEIHNVYNMSDPNMYGVAIQYLLDSFSEEDAPRAMFMSATPVSGHPAEIVDLLNMLVPRSQLPNGRPLRREDFIRKDGTVLEGKERLISSLAAGRVSFLKTSMEDTDPTDPVFPEREFEGKTLKGSDGENIPYVKVVHCEMSAMQKEALKAWAAEKYENGMDREVLPSPADYGLHDIVFPDPAGGAPLYSNRSVVTLATAPPDWMGGSVTVDNGVATGPFLDMPELAKYSAKYAAFVESARKVVKDGPGKILAYHARVRYTGANLLADILRRNGFVGMGEPPTKNTLSSETGETFAQHKASRKKSPFVPARFAVVSNDLSKAEKERALAEFNLRGNVDGHRIRILIGTDVIVQGLDFKAVRHQFILTVPRNFATLKQILGRSVRRGAFSQLPPGERKVKVSMFLTTGSVKVGGKTVHSPDVLKLTRKKANFMQIQKVQSALWSTAVNGFLQQSAPLANRAPSIDGISFKVPVTYEDAKNAPRTEITYYAYGAAGRNLERVTKIIKHLLTNRPVWNSDDIKEAVRKMNYTVNGSTFDDGLIELALTMLTKPAVRARTSAGELAPSAHFMGFDGTLRRVAKVNSRDGKTVYISLPFSKTGDLIVDAESYMRSISGDGAERGVSLKAYSKTHLETAGIERAINSMLEELSEIGAQEIRKAQRRTLATYPSKLHEHLLKEICVLGTKTEIKKKYGEVGMAQALMYEKFKLLVNPQEVKSVEGYYTVTSGINTKATYVGYASTNSYVIWSGGKWLEIPKQEMGVLPRTVENDEIVGYTEERKSFVRFKIREPSHVLSKKQVRDVRSLSKGAVCETRPRPLQIKYAKQMTGKSSTELRGLGSGELCGMVLDKMLENEEKARNSKMGMQRGTRWFYLYNDQHPSIA